MSIAPIATDDPAQLKLELARVQRVAQANRKRLRLFKVRPEPPRGVNLDRGYISWEQPRELSNVTHYNIYADDDTQLFRRVPVGQTKLSDIMPDTKQIWVSSYNEESGLESIKKLAGSDADPDVSGENPITEPPPAPAAQARYVDSVAVTYESQSSNDAAGSQMNRLKITWKKTGWSADELANCKGFAVWGKSSAADGSGMDANYVILAIVEDPTVLSVYSPWLPTATTAKRWTVWVMTRNADGILNPVAGAPSAYTNPAVPPGVGSIDLTKAWNFDSSIFDSTGPTFTIKSLDAGLIKSGTIKVGGGAPINKPGNMFVYDYQSPGVETMIGWIGAYSGYYGAWFKNLWVGGTDPSNANIRCTGGNLSIWDAQFTVRRANPSTQQIYTSPTTYDATYNSLALVVEETATGDKAEFIDRGMVIWNNGVKVGAFVRHPTDTKASVFVAYGTLSRSITADGSTALVTVQGSNGSLLVQLAGDAGTVRADGGYGMSGAVVINSSRVFVGAGVSTTGAVSGASLQVSGADVINSSKVFVGAGVLCPNNGIGALGFNPWNGTQYLNGQTGTFTSQTGKTITVTGGVITNIPAGA